MRNLGVELHAHPLAKTSQSNLNKLKQEEELQHQNVSRDSRQMAQQKLMEQSFASKVKTQQKESERGVFNDQDHLGTKLIRDREREDESLMEYYFEAESNRDFNKHEERKQTPAT